MGGGGGGTGSEAVLKTNGNGMAERMYASQKGGHSRGVALGVGGRWGGAGGQETDE